MLSTNSKNQLTGIITTCHNYDWKKHLKPPTSLSWWISTFEYLHLGGFHTWEYPRMVGFFHGNYQKWLGYLEVQKYDLGNHHFGWWFFPAFNILPNSMVFTGGAGHGSKTENRLAQNHGGGGILKWWYTILSSRSRPFQYWNQWWLGDLPLQDITIYFNKTWVLFIYLLMGPHDTSSQIPNTRRLWEPNHNCQGGGL